MSAERRRYRAWTLVGLLVTVVGLALVLGGFWAVLRVAWEGGPWYATGWNVLPLVLVGCITVAVVATVRFWRRE